MHCLFVSVFHNFFFLALSVSVRKSQRTQRGVCSFASHNLKGSSDAHFPLVGMILLGVHVKFVKYFLKNSFVHTDLFRCIWYWATAYPTPLFHGGNGWGQKYTNTTQRLQLQWGLPSLEEERGFFPPPGCHKVFPLLPEGLFIAFTGRIHADLCLAFAKISTN